MNVVIKHNGTAITQYVTNYSREQDICEGVGTASITLDRSARTRNFTTYDTITITEEGVKKGTYYIYDVSEAVPTNEITINCQDATKLLQDYFIPDVYNTEDTPYLASYWINKFLAETGVDYSIDATTGDSYVQNDTSFGSNYAIDEIIRLLQQCGWYLKADSENVIHVDHITQELENSVYTLNDTNILNYAEAKNDSALRNRVIVWGKGDPDTDDFVFAKQEVDTPWNYDVNDKRAIVVSNSNIPDNASAAKIAKQLLDEYQRITFERTIEFVGAPDIEIGDVVLVDSKFNYGYGLVTNLKVEMSSSGLTTTVILDQRCPRLIAYFDYGGYVYISTLGSGVWRKHLKLDHTWKDFSTGLTSLNIVDLDINNGIFACVSNEGDLYYRKSSWSTWYKFNPTSFVDTINDKTYTADEVNCVACSVDKINSNVYALYNRKDWYSSVLGLVIPSGEPASWLADISPKTYPAANYTFITMSGITTSGIDSMNAVGTLDIDNNGKDKYLTGYSDLGTEVLHNMQIQYAHPYGGNNYFTALPGQIDLSTIPISGMYTYPYGLNSYESPIVSTLKYNFDVEQQSATVSKVIRRNFRAGTEDVITTNETFADIAKTAWSLGYSQLVYTYYMTLVDENEVVVSFPERTGASLYPIENYKVYRVNFGSGLATLIATIPTPENDIYGGADPCLCVCHLYTKNGITYIFYTDNPTSGGNTYDLQMNINGSATTKIFDNLGEPETYDNPSGNKWTPAPNMLFLNDNGTYLFGGIVAYSLADHSKFTTLNVFSYNLTTGVLHTDSVNVSCDQLVLNQVDINNVLTTNLGYLTCSQLNSGVWTNLIYKVDLTDCTLSVVSSTENVSDKSFNPGLTSETKDDSLFLDYFGNMIICKDEIIAPTNYTEGGFMVIKYDGANFNKVYSVPAYPSKIDLSRDTPMTVFGGQDWFNNGFIYVSPNGEANTYQNLELLHLVNGTLDGQGNVTDARSFDIINASGISQNNQDITGTVSRCAFFAINNELPDHDHSTVRYVDFNYNLTGDVYVYQGKLYTSDGDEITTTNRFEVLDMADFVVFSGFANHLETTNFGYDKTPYFFVSIAGAPPVFYQRDKDTSSFVQRITSIPNSEITQIRADNKL